jgi:NAD+ kinase
MTAREEPAVRCVLLVVHARRSEARDVASQMAAALTSSGIEIRIGADDAEEMALPGSVIVAADERAADGCELVVVLGGDGTILRGAERARGADVPLLGINLGHVGFLAEAELEAVDDVARAIVDRTWSVEERMVIDVVITLQGREVDRTWALNDVSLEKATREHMIEVLVEIDGRPLSRWGCDGVVCATPTGSTAYAFSAGGPVVWPQVEALLVVPISAHALFARPLVVSPSSVIAWELPDDRSQAVLSADGRRAVDIPAGGRIEIRRHARPVRLARLSDSPFTDRLVAKFSLPVDGWRGRR